jgi:hypothetical protein
MRVGTVMPIEPPFRKAPPVSSLAGRSKSLTHRPRVDRWPVTVTSNSPTASGGGGAKIEAPVVTVSCILPEGAVTSPAIIIAWPDVALNTPPGWRMSLASAVMAKPPLAPSDTSDRFHPDRTSADSTSCFWRLAGKTSPVGIG